MLINCITDIGIIHATVQIKNNPKASAGLCRISLDAVCIILMDNVDPNHPFAHVQNDLSEEPFTNDATRN